MVDTVYYNLNNIVFNENDYIFISQIQNLGYSTFFRLM